MAAGIGLSNVRTFATRLLSGNNSIIRTSCHSSVFLQIFLILTSALFFHGCIMATSLNFCKRTQVMIVIRLYELLKTNIRAPHLSQITEIADAINYLHSYDPPIVHADIRGVSSNRKWLYRDVLINMMQANVLVTHDLHCRLADIGLVSIMDSVPLMNTSSTLRVALRWMAPEYIQVNAPHRAQPPRDIYAFGCTIYEVWVIAHTPFFTNHVARYTPASPLFITLNRTLRFSPKF